MRLTYDSEPETTAETPAEAPTTAPESKEAPGPETTAASGKSETPASTTASPSESKDTAKKSGIGSSGWFKSAVPFGKRKSVDKCKSKQSSSPQPASAGAEQSADKQGAHLPPNYLGVNVPSGTSDDLADLNTQAPGQNKLDAMSSPAEPSSSSQANDSVMAASAEGVNSGSTSQRSGSASGGGHPVGQLRGSRASIAAPAGQRIFNPHATNPGRIPTAGGVAVGSKQFETRRQSRVSASDIQQSLPKLDKEASPDLVTQNNTAPQGIKEEDESKSEAPAAGAGKTAEPSGDMFSNPFAGGDTSAGAEKTEPAPAKENVTPETKAAAPASTPAEETTPSPASPSKERRGSTIERLKGVFKSSKK